jgi:hypothetical protein|tara:strand:- start:1076 stop:1846 length:771 start_codon:yes stop_codon:yes gene_type:complete
MAWEWLEKYLKGSMAQPNAPDVIAGAATEPRQGLFGTGGNFGQGGLLTTFNKNPNAGNNMFEMLSNPAVGIGASIFTKGMKGEDIGTSAFPAVKEGLTFSESVSRINTARKKRKYIQDYKDKVPPKDMEIFMAFPEKYITAKLSKEFSTPSLSKEALALYQVARTKGSGDNFNTWFATLPKADQDLYNKQIRPNIGRLEAILAQGAKADEKKEGGKIITKEKIKDYRTQFLSVYPGQTITDEMIIRDLVDNYGYSQ